MKNKKFLSFILVVLSLVALAVFAVSCSNNKQTESTAPSNEAVVVFNTNTTLETNVGRERYVVKGRRVSEPKLFVTAENPDNLNVYV